jgi:DNA-binding transcriptional MerR regulator
MSEQQANDGRTVPALEASPRLPAFDQPVIAKEYYSIGEVCDLVGLKPHVLRYWETQFPALSPSKNRAGNRVYQRREIKLILLVKHLLYKEKYTIEGAKRKLAELRRGGELQQASNQALNKEMLDLLRAELQEVLATLAPIESAE